MVKLLKQEMIEICRLVGACGSIVNLGKLDMEFEGLVN
jgi:hypothetical protein